jgi:hypothetical protein
MVYGDWNIEVMTQRVSLFFRIILSKFEGMLVSFQISLSSYKTNQFLGSLGLVIHVGQHTGNQMHGMPIHTWG